VIRRKGTAEVTAFAQRSPVTGFVPFTHLACCACTKVPANNKMAQDKTGASKFFMCAFNFKKIKL
jgi:hypothetical protein